MDLNFFGGPGWTLDLYWEGRGLRSEKPKTGPARQTRKPRVGVNTGAGGRKKTVDEVAVRYWEAKTIRWE